MHPMLNIAVKAARRAGTIINRASVDVESLRVGRKQANDFVTEVDQAAEAAIIEVLQQAYPDHAILGEESGLVLGRGAESVTDFDFASAENVWILDPLDGTTNFIHGLPQYAVSIALMQRGQITNAVVYDPSKNELFTASKGRGAFLNERRIRVSKRVQLQESLIGTGFPFRNIETIDSYLGMFKAVSQKAAGLRRPGAAALDLAYVACGRYDGFFELGLSPWDAAAGALLVQEAGGLIADFNGEGDWLFGENIIAGTPKVFTQLLQTLTGFPRPETNRTQDMLAQMRRGEGVSLAQVPQADEGEGNWADPTVRAVRPSRSHEVSAELAADAAQVTPTNAGSSAGDESLSEGAESDAAEHAQDLWGGDSDLVDDAAQAAGAEHDSEADTDEATLDAASNEGDADADAHADAGDEEGDEEGDAQPFFGADADMFDAGAQPQAEEGQAAEGEASESNDVNGNVEGYVPQPRRFDGERAPRGDQGGYRGGERSGGYGDRGGDRGGYRGGERTGGYGDRGGFRGGERTGGFGDRSGGGGFRGGERTGGFGDRSGGGGFRGGEQRPGGFGDRTGGGGFRGGERTGGFGDRSGGGGFRGGEQRTGGFGDRSGGGGFRGGEQRTGGFGDRTGGGGGSFGGDRGPRRFGDGAGRSEGRSFGGPRGGDRGGDRGGSGGGRGGFGGGSGGGRGGFGGGSR